LSYEIWKSLLHSELGRPWPWLSFGSLGGMTPRWIHLAFGLVWLFTALSFGFLARDAHDAEAIALPRFQGRIPHEYNVEINGIRFQDVINGIADTHDKSVAELESSIRASAILKFRLELLSFFMAIVGFVAQTGQYLHEQRKHSRRKSYAAHHKRSGGVLVTKLQEGDTKHENTNAA
jgi:hypothetical protein